MDHPRPSGSRSWGTKVLLKSLAVVVLLAAAGLGVRYLSVPAHDPPSYTGADACLSRVTPGTPAGAHAARGWDGFWSSYGNSGVGWTAADGGYSVSVPGLGELWMYADTYIGSVGPQGRLHGPRLIHNSFVLESNSGIHTYFRGTHTLPLSLVGGSHYIAYWPGPAVVVGHTVQVLFSQFHATQMSTITFLRSVVAQFSLPSMSLVSVTPVPSPYHTIWSSWTMTTGGYTYIYGVGGTAFVKLMHVARVRGDNLLGRWQYWSTNRWSYNPNDSTQVMSGISASFSVVRVNGVYVLVTIGTRGLARTLHPGGNIDAYFSCSPVGPFVGRRVIYRIKSQLKGGVLAYNAIAHPELSNGRTLLVSYSVHGPTISMLGQPASEYRPRYVWLKLPIRS